MHQEALRRHVLRLLRIWRDWFIFADDFLNGLQVSTTLHQPLRYASQPRHLFFFCNVISCICICWA